MNSFELHLRVMEASEMGQFLTRLGPAPTPHADLEEHRAGDDRARVAMRWKTQT